MVPCRHYIVRVRVSCMSSRLYGTLQALYCDLCQSIRRRAAVKMVSTKIRCGYEYEYEHAVMSSNPQQVWTSGVKNSYLNWPP